MRCLCRAMPAMGLCRAMPAMDLCCVMLAMGLCCVMPAMAALVALARVYSVFSSVVRYFCLFLLDTKKRE